MTKQEYCCIEGQRWVDDTGGNSGDHPGDCIFDDTQGPPFPEGSPQVILRFKTEDDKQNFMSGLSDGWGEGMCDLYWPWEKGMKFHECQIFDVTSQDPDGEDY